MGRLIVKLLSDEYYRKLPLVLRETCDTASTTNEKDLLLISTLGVLSGVVHCYGVYDNRDVSPNLYVLIIAPAASGKGIMNYTVRVIGKYAVEFKQTQEDNNKIKTLIIPANISASSFYEVLESNNGEGVIFETEIDTMTTALKQDWGNFSDVLRKGFHQERISQLRKGEPRQIEIEQPRFSVVLSGTPGQLKPFIDSSENGLFSRFVFYSFEQNAKWRDVSPSNSRSLDAVFDSLADKYLIPIKHTKQYPFELKLTEEQWKTINESFGSWTDTAVRNNPQLLSTIKRLGVVTFKICLVLTALRRSQESKTEVLATCHEDDFQIAIRLASSFKYNAEQLLKSYANEKSNQNPILRFLDKLPIEFKRKDIIESFVKDYSERTIDNYLNELTGQYLLKIKDGHYKKV